MHKRLDDKDEECEDLHAKMRKARAKQLTAERHLNLFSLDLECVSFKLNKFREFMGDPFNADYGDILFDEGADGLRNGTGGESSGKSSFSSPTYVQLTIFKAHRMEGAAIPPSKMCSPAPTEKNIPAIVGYTLFANQRALRGHLHRARQRKNQNVGAYEGARVLPLVTFSIIHLDSFLTTRHL